MDIIYERKMLEGLALAQQQIDILRRENAFKEDSVTIDYVNEFFNRVSEEKSTRIPKFTKREEAMAELILAILLKSATEGLFVASATVAKLKFLTTVSKITPKWPSSPSTEKPVT